MSTVIQEAPAAAKSTGFEFDSAGVCTNPDKEVLRVAGMGSACALLVACDGDAWLPGFQCGGRNLAFTTVPPMRGSAAAGTNRAAALRIGGELVAHYIAGLTIPAAVAIRDALTGYFKEPVPVHPAGSEKRSTDPVVAPPCFIFDSEGDCTNPERVEIPCPAGYQCALLVAQMPDGQWTFGAIRAGRDEELFKYTPLLVANGEPTREGALEIAASIARQNGPDVSPINDALDAWVADLAAKAAGRAKTQPQTESDTMKQKAKTLDYAALAGSARSLAQAGEAATGIAVKLGLSGSQLEKVLSRAGLDGPGPWVEKPAEAPESAPANIAPGGAPAAVLPGMAHKLSTDRSVFIEWEDVVVPMPKKVRCTLHLSQDGRGRWSFGLNLSLPTAGITYAPRALDQAFDSGFDTRERALDEALLEARGFFESPGNLSDTEKKLANRANEAVVRFREEFRAKLLEAQPAEPAPTPRVAPSYKTEFAELPVAKIQENPTNHRKHYGSEALHELGESIKSDGLHQPIAVRKLLEGEIPAGELPLGDPGAPEYELIFGHRRRRAALVAGVPTLMSRIYLGLTRQQATVIALIENLQRVDINALEEAEGYEQLMADERLTQQEAADRVGRPRSTVAHALRLLKLPANIREDVREGRLAAEHGKALVRFVPSTDAQREEWAKDNPNWERVVRVMAENAILQKVSKEYLEKGVPFITSLVGAGLAVRIDQFGEFRVNPKQKEHPAYFATGDGDWVCFNPEHWTAEVAERKRKAAEREEADRQRREAEMAKLTKSGRKQLKLEELDPKAYREFTGADEALLSLVPDDKKAAAKGDAGRTTVVTDVVLAERLQKAMLRAIRENRKEAAGDLRVKVEKKIAGLKKVGPREMAWLVYLIADVTERGITLRLDGATARAVGAKIPPAACVEHIGGIWIGHKNTFRPQRLAALAKSEAADLVRVLMAERLGIALEEVIAGGPQCDGAEFIKWWLDSDTLWLLEETEEGRAELVEKVKAAKWYASLMAGESTEDES